MKANEKRNQKAPRFRPGRAGCEALMFVVRGYAPSTPVTDPDGKLNPKDTLRIAATDIHEVMQYMKRWEPNFDIRSIRSTGLVVLLSGSPYQE
jgi:hypothetical protein